MTNLAFPLQRPARLRAFAFLKGILFGLAILLQQTSLLAEEAAFPVRADRILFLGDSITYSGKGVVLIESALHQAGVNPVPEIINIGLPSETVTGLTEPGHPFPRPNVHERLERALTKTKPDVVVICYGMNDGIYAPFDGPRFAEFQSGLLKLISEVHESGAKIVLLTPTTFDALPIKASVKDVAPEDFEWNGMYARYDEDVLAKYSEWILSVKDKVEMVVDLRTPLLNEIKSKRQESPDFTMVGDGVHLNDEGHRVVAEAILSAWNVVPPSSFDTDLVTLVAEKQGAMKDAWLNEIGHERPGMPAGLPVAEASEHAQALNQRIQNRLSELR